MYDRKEVGPSRSAPKSRPPQKSHFLRIFLDGPTALKSSLGSAGSKSGPQDKAVGAGQGLARVRKGRGEMQPEASILPDMRITNTVSLTEHRHG